MASVSFRLCGFSFVELLASMAIVGLLASVALPLATTTAQRSREIELRKALRDIRGALDAYKLAVRQGRIASSPESSGYPANIDELVAGVDDLGRPGQKLYFLRRLPRDPMYTDLSVPAESTWGKRSFDSPPDRPREGRDVFDVYSLSDKRGLNGIPYAEW